MTINERIIRLEDRVKELTDRMEWPDDRFINVAEAAKRLGCNPNTVYRLNELGYLRGASFGRLKFIPEDIKEFMHWAVGKTMNTHTGEFRDNVTGEVVIPPWMKKADIITVGKDRMMS